jgi:nicotinamidase-related amidase
MGIKELFLIGVATDMVVESTAREAHDRDFVVTIISDCCIAANDKDHQRSLENMQKLSTIITSDTLELNQLDDS